MLPAAVAAQVQATLLSYLRTTFRFHNDPLEAALLTFLQDRERGLFRGPFVDLRLPFRREAPGAHGEPPLDYLPPFIPYAHQLRAWERLSSREGAPRATLVTTGTGSGKTECFLYPILDHCLREKRRGVGGIKAILLYPMNALASDQAERLARELQDPRLGGQVTAGLYVGGRGRHPLGDATHLVDDRQVLREAPPDILLTNYRMLDFLLMRPEDRRLWRDNGPATLRYLVLDELHTYDGAQGSDVGCLLRRLRARLGIPAGALTLVGTSATIGDGSAAERLLQFASDIFGEPLQADARVGEDRLTLAEALPPELPERVITRDPCAGSPTELAQLLPGPDCDPGRYLRTLAKAWLDIDTDRPQAIGEAIRRHVFLRRLLEALHPRRQAGGPTDWQVLGERLATAVPAFAELEPEPRWAVLGSFLNLLAHARDVDDRPLFSLQVQLWVRELRGLVVKVQDPKRHGYTLAFRETLKAEGEPRLRAGREPHWAPIVYCRGCGADGLGAMVQEGRSALKVESRAVGEAYFQRRIQARFLRLHDRLETRDGQASLPQSLCPCCLQLLPGDGPCTAHGTPVATIPAALFESKKKEGERAVFAGQCPKCGAEDALTLLGARVATLSSVVINQLFHSPLHIHYTEAAGRSREVPKLLAFTDSVQDASHRAGFFSGRTYRFNLRAAIQGTLQRLQQKQGGGATGGPGSGDVGVPLPGFAALVMAEFAAQLGSEGRALSAFMPADLRELDDYADYRAALAEALAAGQAEPERAVPAALRLAARRAVETRLGWEITRELGLAVNVGRSLEQTGSATLAVQPDLLQTAVERVTLALREEGMVAPISGEVEPVAVRHFVEGLCNRLRLRGGICHPLLLTYMRSGRPFALSKRMQPLLSPFPRGTALPRFLYEGAGHPLFDPLYGKPRARTWLRDWVHRCLHVRLDDPGIDRLLKRTVDELSRVGILQREPCGDRSTLGLAPEALRLTARVSRVHCRVCNNALVLPTAVAATWEHATCTRFKCRGRLWGGRRVPVSADYYGDLYRGGRVQRIYAREHTGLLTRPAREALEGEFKEDRPGRRLPDAPNLLTCTPTLEMGIDIGDLSAVMLCSVPPSAASYQQRVGRAGRKSGNALVTTMVRARPHDLYFHAQPQEMMRAAVDPPGVFLDAPEMLLRQLTAHALDQWARDAQGVDRIPHQLQYLLGPANREGFPNAFYDYYAPRAQALTAAFCGLFSGLSERTRMQLEGFGREGAVPERMRRAFADVAEERKRLASELRTLQERKRRLQADPERAPLSESDPGQTVQEAAEQARAQLEEAIRVHRRILGQLSKKHPLNVLTDAGVLPNYAFPEPGVTLQAVLRARDGAGRRGADGRSGRGPSQQHEYMRPASAALREFAPFNTFYADGHRIRISRIDIGTRVRPQIETVRQCPRCTYGHQVTDGGAVGGACPRCGCPSFADRGALHQVVPFRQAFSNMDLLDSVVVDETEEREERAYRVQDLVDVGPEHWGGARLLAAEPVVFGYELLRGVTIRQLNWGQIADTGHPIEVAGEHIAQQGFRVCAHCGRVQDPFARDHQGEHVPFCPTLAAGRKEHRQAEHWLHVALSRSMRSEALRVLLPTASYGRERILSTLRAALQLGFRQLFGGQAGHLRYTTMSEPAGEERRHFLVIFDAVPGGTGYLADLWQRPERFVQLLALAHDRIERCRCEDGCYRCVYAYQDARVLPHISRRLAAQLLGEVLRACGAQGAGFADIQTLSQARVEVVGESELEQRFLDTLIGHAEAQRDWSVQRLPWQGRTEFRLKAGDCSWRLVPQVDLGPKDGVALRCRPDFVVYPSGEHGADVLPVAIFCDGLRYHVMPGDAHSRLGDDIDKRRALLESGCFRVWSVTWDDVTATVQGGQEIPPSLLGHAADGAATKVFGPGGGAIEDRDLGRTGSLDLLLRYLAAPDPARWRRRAVCSALSLLMQGQQLADGAAHARALGEQLGRSTIELASGKGATVPGGFAHGLAQVGEPVQLLAQRQGKGVALILRLFDDPQTRMQAGFVFGWRAFLHAWNVLQHGQLPLTVVSDEWLERHHGAQPDGAQPGAPAEEPAVPSPGVAVGDGALEAPQDLLSLRPPAAGEDEALLGLLSDIPEAEPLVALLRARGLPLPAGDLQHLGPRRQVLAEALLHFPVQRLVLVEGLSDTDVAVWQEAGYRALDAEAGFAEPGRVVAALTAGLKPGPSTPPKPKAAGEAVEDEPVSGRRKSAVGITGR